MALKEYPHGSAFAGKIGLTTDDSEPAWPAPRRARRGAPNVLFIVLDDVGYGQLGCYGGLSETPHIDRLARNGLLYTNMHTTALCSPTRSCILTGRNHHSNAMGGITELSTGYPGYNGQIPFENGFLSEILQGAGYNTWAVGKWHLTPTEQESAAGPYDRWPLGRGFERYYGFLGGETHQYYPNLVSDNRQVDPPATPEDGYHLTADLTARAIAAVADAKQVAPDKPFFLYFCPGAMHAPHHVPREWADRYAGRFDMGWDEARERIFARQKQLGLVTHDARLPGRDPDVPEWSSLGDDERRLYARMMEVFAGFLTHTDHHIGLLLDKLEQLGELDNTLVMLISDNGASAEGGTTGSVNEDRFFNNVPDELEDNLAAIDELGGPRCYNHYPWGWTWAGNTPFRRWKRETFRGGVSDPFLVHWPAGIKARGELRTQYAHAIDLVPTVLEALELDGPREIRGVTQAPFEGVSFAHTFDDEQVASLHRTQYFEMFGHRSIYHDGWRAVCPWPGDSFSEGRAFGTPLTTEDLRRLDVEGWQLYHLAPDPTESRDIAAEHPDRLRELIALWYVEAGKYNVLPIDGRAVERLAESRPQITHERSRYLYRPGTQGVPNNAAVSLLNKSFLVTAEVEVPEGGADGVLLCHGGCTSGYTIFVKDGRLNYVHNYVARHEFRVEAEREVPPGRHLLRVEFTRTGEPDLATGKGAPGRVRLFVDDQVVGEGDIPVTVPIAIGLSTGMMCGRSAANPITDLYQPPFAYSGTLHGVMVEVGQEAVGRDRDLQREARVREAMARQ